MRISFRNVLFAVVLVGGTAYGIMHRAELRNLGSNSEKHKQILELQRQNRILQEQIAAKQNYLTRLQQNPDDLKLEIERRLKLVTPGTKQFILQDGQDGTQPPDSVPSP